MKEKNETTVLKLNYFRRYKNKLVTESLEVLSSLRRLNGLLSSSNLSVKSLLLGVVGLRLDLTSLLESGNNVLVLPANFVTQSTDGGVLSTRLQSENSESLGNDNTLETVVRGGNTLEDLQSLKSGLTTSSLVGDHTTDGLVQDAGRSTEVEGTVSLVVTSTLTKVSVVLQLGAEEFTRNVQSLSANNNDLLTVKNLLSNDTGKTTEKVSLTYLNS